MTGHSGQLEIKVGLYMWPSSKYQATFDTCYKWRTFFIGTYGDLKKIHTRNKDNVRQIAIYRMSTQSF